MWLKTLKANLLRESRWLKYWDVEDKRNELWDKLANLVEEIYHRKVPIEEVNVFFTSRSVGFTTVHPGETFAGRKVIAVIKRWDFPEFRNLYPTSQIVAMLSKIKVYFLSLITL